ncbi:SMI1/KNR4 family protein [Pseudoalteromonas sp. SMS1]|uniref:SMI1/KNR4 family protein n=1 Tax=Pseudoalteromonas sp. SMS1 TaxID=2908894 RepID=UPI001F2CF78F|nr:SMI1/KNR4 family protein [Pseudoalteromonas sp. SMS1]MCF2860201.1 SMI1/KNR4 family protein [Pseudoalteromonas sp. SMS1]
MISKKSLLCALKEIKDSRAQIKLDFSKIEKSLKSTLPLDYKVLCETFADGFFLDRIRLLSPQMDGGQEKVNYEIASKLKLMEVNRKDFPEFYNYCLFPEPKGLLTFALSDNGEYIFWVCNGRPEDWTIAVMSEDGHDLEFYNNNLIGFLIGLAEGHIITSILVEERYDKEAGFFAI